MATLASPSDLALLVGAPADDPKVTLALRRASDRFEGEIGYRVELVTGDAVAVSGDGGERLWLPGRPVVGTPVVTIGGEPVTDFETNRRIGFLRRAGGWPVGEDNVEVTFTHGWDVDDIPGAITDAVLEHAEQVYRSLVGVASVQAGSEQVAFFASMQTGVTQKWTDIVELYRCGMRP